MEFDNILMCPLTLRIKLFIQCHCIRPGKKLHHGVNLDDFKPINNLMNIFFFSFFSVVALSTIRAIIHLNWAFILCTYLALTTKKAKGKVQAT
jgi:hypothetical protein